MRSFCMKAVISWLYKKKTKKTRGHSSESVHNEQPNTIIPQHDSAIFELRKTIFDQTTGFNSDIKSWRMNWPFALDYTCKIPCSY